MCNDAEIAGTGRSDLEQRELRSVLQSIPLFATLDSDEADDLISGSKVIRLDPGEVLVNRGDIAHSIFVVIDGEFEVLRSAGTETIPIGVRGRGDLVGEVALLTEGPRTATLRAYSDARVLEIHHDTFRPWLERHPPAVLTLLGTIVDRLQSAEAHLVQHQHLTALGTLAAGLAHELNNPAAAILRNVSQLDNSIQEWQRVSRELGHLDQSGQSSLVGSLTASLGTPPSTSLEHDPIARADEEDAIARWLGGMEAPANRRMASTLVDGGWTVSTLQELLQKVPVDSATTSLEWLAAGSSVHRSLVELRLSAQVVADLVSAVKSYSRLDEAPVQDVDIHSGIDQAITILRHKLRGITVTKDYETTLPNLTANPGQLNQIWTNLLANAADAAGNQGNVLIRTRSANGSVVIDIEDDGPGIAPDIQPRIFEPFFTTKPPGDGTGLGLAISQSIAENHRGSIELTSQPGLTRFRVKLPLRG